MRELDRDHLDVVEPRLFLEEFAIKLAVFGACAEIAGADLPADVTAALQMVVGEAALPGIMKTAGHPRAGVQRDDRIGRQRPEAHGRDVET